MKNLIWLLVVTSLLTSACGSNRAAEGEATAGATADETHLDDLGTDKGNGADDISPIAMSAWFADADKEITYCFDVDAEFGYDTSELDAVFERSFGRWVSYYKEKETVIQRQNAFLSTEARKLEKCDGSEDLHLYFGVINKELQQAASQFDLPWAFSVQKSHDVKSRWSKGYLWFAREGQYPGKSKPKETKVPSWKNDAALEILMTHEMGHVFGVDHIPNTIMDKDIVKSFGGRVANVDVDPANLEIDQEFELLGKTYKGALGKADQVEANFELLTGRKSEGEVEATVERLHQFAFELKLKDARGEEKMQVTGVSDSRSLTCDSRKVFKVATKENFAVNNWFTCSTQMGTVKLPSGKTLSIQIVQNVSLVSGDWDEEKDGVASGRLTMRFIDSTESRVLFQSLR